MAYDTYFLMKAEDVPAYVQEKIHYFNGDTLLESKEIGDGNLNYVFRVTEPSTGRSIIVKQAGPELRIAKSLHASIDRGRIESEILRIQDQCSPGSVPKVYLYDSIMKTIIEEDMVGHTMMRTALLNHEIFPLFADQITTFMVYSLLKTTDVCMEHKEKKESVRSFINPELCEISEDLVFSEPFMDYNHRNNVFAPNKDFVEKELYQDTALQLEAAKLKFEFMNNAQSLIHGDLHTGSIFINQEHTFVFDPEFACYGPMGYDVGNIIANLFFAWCNGDAVIESPEEKDIFCGWCLSCISDVIDLFISKFSVCWDENTTDTMAKVPGFKDYYLKTVLSDTAAMAGLESIRRMVGLANVKDITSITDESKRARAERIVIRLAKNYIMNRTHFLCGNDYIQAIKKAIAAES
ncbi:Methylthioribose kinase [uncultured Roseburia sp.]|uniref:S-methyl-5-thioribose kinase n=1 Tax=Brotonthovivens ammoniilytica TaxID=2981725 RepID=A0ABT2TFA7_9FIRM|nr:S-methyl-5-thioribose kinase [Brotonthovivens ammoniilytica]MCU6760867.1 S-methyl-5-thioribose kinase [Brotonthovivens ammoniilytica]SCI11684.1 Methylthioribose kinase [uncultured Roseburia sp.]